MPSPANLTSRNEGQRLTLESAVIRRKEDTLRLLRHMSPYRGVPIDRSYMLRA